MPGTDHPADVPDQTIDTVTELVNGKPVTRVADCCTTGRHIDQLCGDQQGWAGHHNVCTLPPHPGDPWHQADPHPDWPDIPGTRWRHNTPADDRLDLPAITQQLQDGPTEATTDRIKWSPIITVSHETITDATTTDQPSTTREGGSDV